MVLECKNNVIGAERFNTCVAQGAKMTYDELVTWLEGTLDRLAGAQF
jgi:hypothetical protein